MTARFESFGEADADLPALNPGIRPVLLLIKQVDQVSALNGRLPPAGESPGPSPRRRHDVFGAGADARGPAGGHGLEKGVEAHAFHAVHRHVAEKGALPAAEAVEGHWRRNRHVGADHADPDAVGGFARRFAVAGEDRGALAVFVTVDELGRRVEPGDDDICRKRLN